MKVGLNLQELRLILDALNDSKRQSIALTLTNDKHQFQFLNYESFVYRTTSYRSSFARWHGPGDTGVSLFR
jgi:hypothetical protein